MANSEGCRAGTPLAAEVADDSANALATLPPTDAWGAAPDLEGQLPAQDKDDKGHHPQPHDHSHEENNNPNDHGAQPHDNTESGAAPPDAVDAASPATKARSASNKTPPSEGVAAHKNYKRLKSKQSVSFEPPEAIMSDPASVVDHEARHTRWAELFDEALKSYRDVSVAAVVVSWVLLCMVGVVWLVDGVHGTGRTRMQIRTTAPPLSRYWWAHAWLAHYVHLYSVWHCQQSASQVPASAHTPTLTYTAHSRPPSHVSCLST